MGSYDDSVQTQEVKRKRMMSAIMTYYLASEILGCAVNAATMSTSVANLVYAYDANVIVIADVAASLLMR